MKNLVIIVLLITVCSTLKIDIKCPAGQYLSNDTNNVCANCPFLCALCTGPSYL